MDISYVHLIIRARRRRVRTCISTRAYRTTCSALQLLPTRRSRRLGSGRRCRIGVIRINALITDRHRADRRERRLRASAGHLLSSSRSALWARASYRDLVGGHGEPLMSLAENLTHMAVTSTTCLSRAKRWCLVRFRLGVERYFASGPSQLVRSAGPSSTGSESSSSPSRDHASVGSMSHSAHATSMRCTASHVSFVSPLRPLQHRGCEASIRAPGLSDLGGFALRSTLRIRHRSR